MNQAQKIKEVSECYKIILSMLKTKPGEIFEFSEESKELFQKRVNDIIKNLLISIIISGKEDGKYQSTPDMIKMGLLMSFNEFTCYSPATKNKITIINSELKREMEQQSQESLQEKSEYWIRFLDDIKQRLAKEGISIDDCFEQVRNCCTHTGMTLKDNVDVQKKYVSLNNGKIQCEISLEDFADVAIMMFNEFPKELLEEIKNEEQTTIDLPSTQLKNYADVEEALSKNRNFFICKVRDGAIGENDVQIITDYVGEILESTPDTLSVQDINNIVAEQFPQYSGLIIFMLDPRVQAQVTFYIKSIGEESFFALNQNIQGSLIDLFGQQTYNLSVAEIIAIGVLNIAVKTLHSGNVLDFAQLLPEKETNTIIDEFYKEVVRGEMGAGNGDNMPDLTYKFPKLYEVFLYAYMLHILNYIKENITQSTLIQIYGTTDISGIDFQCKYSEEGLSKLRNRIKGIKGELKSLNLSKDEDEKSKDQEEDKRREKQKQLEQAETEGNEMKAKGIQKGISKIDQKIADIDKRIQRKSKNIEELQNREQEISCVLEQMQQGNQTATRMDFFRHLRNAISHKTYSLDFEIASQTGRLEDISIIFEDKDKEAEFIAVMTIARFLELAEEIVTRLEIVSRDEVQPVSFKDTLLQESLRAGISVNDMPILEQSKDKYK